MLRPVGVGDQSGRVLALLLLMVVALGSQRARASNEDDFFVGDRAAMMGGAVTATVDDGSAAYYNHAGLAGVKDSKVDVSASVYSLRLYKVSRFLSVEDGPSTDASVSEFVAIPTQIAYVRELSPCVTLGLGYFVPKAENALLSERLTVGDDDTGSTWALDTHSTRSSAWLVAAIGLQAHKRVRVGFGLFGAYETATESLSFFGSVTDGGVLEKAVEVSTLGTSTGLGLAPGAGLQLELGRGLTMGIWAHGPQMRFFGSTTDSVHVLNGMRDASGTVMMDASSGRISESSEVGFVSAGRYHLALAYARGRSLISAEADLQPGLTSVRTGIDRDLAVNGRVGGMHRLTDDIALGAGIFSDRSTAPSNASSSIDYYGATFGIEVGNTLRLAEDEPADEVLFRSVFALRYAFGRGDTATLIADPAADVADLLVNGESKETVHEFALHVGSSVQF